jgi:hypothetical protein
VPRPDRSCDRQFAYGQADGTQSHPTSDGKDSIRLRRKVAPGMVTSSPAWSPGESFTRFPCRHPWRQSIAARALPPRRAQGRGPGRALVTRDHEALLVSIYLSHGCVHRLDNPGRSHSPSSKYSPVAILARTTSCGSKARTDVDNPLPVALVAGINGREGASLLDSC